MGGKTSTPLSPRKRGKKTEREEEKDEKEEKNEKEVKVEKTSSSPKKTSTPLSPRKSGKKTEREEEKIIEEDEDVDDWEKWIPRYSLPKNQGLMDKKTKQSIALKSMEVKVDIVDICVQVEFIQVYVNETKNPIETMYNLVLPLKTAVSQFSVVVDGKTIKGVVKTIEEATNDYDDAIASGHGGYMVQKTKNKLLNEFKIHVGNIPPDLSSEVHITFIYTAFNRKGNYVFNLPGELLPEGTPTKGICNIKMSDKVTKVYTSRGKVTEDFSSVTWGENDFSGNSELTIILHLEKLEIPRAVLETDPETKSVALMVTNTPVWKNLNPDLIETQVEVIFVVDRSGSMSGDRMSQTKEAMNLLIHSLPPNSKFNIIGFGGSQDWLFSTSVTYGEENLEKAYNKIQSMEADLGGTDLLAPFQKIFRVKPDLEYPRILLVITDGEVSNREGTIAEVKRHSAECRVYSLGISAAVDKELVNGIARAGGGESAFVVNNKDIEERVMGLFSQAFQPCTRNIVVEWPGKDVLTAPNKIPPVFKGDRMVAFALIQDSITVDTLSITAVDPMGQPLSWQVPVVHQTGNLVNKLAAYSVIRSLQDDTSEYHVTTGVDANKVKEIITNLGIQHQLTTKYTSFVAVDDRDNEAATGSLTTIGAYPKEEVDDDTGTGTDSDQDEEASGTASGSGSGSDEEASGTASGSGSGNYEKKKEESGSDENLFKKDSKKSKSTPPPPISTNRSSQSEVNKITIFKKNDKMDLNEKKKGEKSKMKKTVKQESEEEEEKKECKKEKDEIFESEEEEEEKGYKEEKDEKKSKKKVVKKEKKEKKSEEKFVKKDKKSEAVKGDLKIASKKAAPSGPSLKGKTDNEQKSLVVSKQKYDGSWELSEMINLLGISQNKVETANPSVTPEVWATALGIAFLEVVLSKSKTTWQMVAKKARAFIAKALINEGKPADDVANLTQTIVENAMSFVKSNF